MAEEQKPVDVAQVAKEETAPEQLPVAETAVRATDDKHEDLKPAEATEEAEPHDEAKEEEAKPIEEGFLGYKTQGASFPKNLIPSREFFFFGDEAVDAEVLSAYKKAEKHAENAHHNIAWAAQTGKGLLFVGDKNAPTGIINLADATEPETDGSNKFHFTAKGSKHSFKAASVAERDNWVAQLKIKTAEAKELVGQVTDSESYKKTIESFKPAAKEEKTEASQEEAVVEDPSAAETAPKEEESLKDESKSQGTKESKRRSASRKRTSFFGFGKKEESKTEETPASEIPVVVEPVTETDVPVVEDARVPAEAAPEADEVKSGEEAQVESPKDKPNPTKRNSFFGVFSKKEKKAADATEAFRDHDVAAESAPVIPPVVSTTPLAVDVTTPAAVSTETAESAAANGETKKEVKEKRKASMPFVFGKRDKSPSPAVEGEEKTSRSAFSKLRATIKGKGSARAEEKANEEAKAETNEAENKDTLAEEGPKDVEAEAENKPEGVAATAPTVTAAA